MSHSSSAAACFMSLNLNWFISVCLISLHLCQSQGLLLFVFLYSFYILHLSYSPVLKHLCFTFYTRLTFFALLCSFSLQTRLSLTFTIVCPLMSLYPSPSPTAMISICLHTCPSTVLCCFIIITPVVFSWSVVSNVFTPVSLSSTAMISIMSLYLSHSPNLVKFVLLCLTN